MLNFVNLPRRPRILATVNCAIQNERAVLAEINQFYNGLIDCYQNLKGLYVFLYLPYKGVSRGQQAHVYELPQRLKQLTQPIWTFYISCNGTIGIPLHFHLFL